MYRLRMRRDDLVALFEPLTKVLHARLVSTIAASHDLVPDALCFVYSVAVHQHLFLLDPETGTPGIHGQCAHRDAIVGHKIFCSGWACHHRRVDADLLCKGVESRYARKRPSEVRIVGQSTHTFPTLTLGQCAWHCYCPFKKHISYFSHCRNIGRRPHLLWSEQESHCGFSRTTKGVAIVASCSRAVTVR